MREYGPNKATEFTKKQISVIYMLAKKQELHVEKWVMSRLYDLADYYGYDDNHSIASEEVNVLEILNNVFSKDIEKAQELIDYYTESIFSMLSKKNKAACNHDLVA